jgi:hypothetical protein
MKKITTVCLALFLTAFAANAQTTNPQPKTTAKKLTTKSKLQKAVHSPKMQAALKNAKQDKRKEGE